MLKALFLDLDETLCDTTGANKKALQAMEGKAKELFSNNIDEKQFAAQYIKGIYRDLDERYSKWLLPVVNEEAFRHALINLILNDAGINNIPNGTAEILQKTFDDARTGFFDFFPSIKELLIELRSHFTLVVITNGPAFSQVVKAEKVELHKYVDHIIIGGQEKEEKPAVSIFQKALTLAQCEAHEAMHIGDSLKADIAGANASGICSVWISHNQDLDESLHIIPTHIIENPFQIRDLIASLHNLEHN